MTTAAVLIPVGPAGVEPARVRDLLASVAAWEPEAVTDAVLVDDAAPARPLAGLAAQSGIRAHVVRTSLDKEGIHPHQAMMAGTLAGLATAGATGADLVFKLDTDALAIAPFVDPVARAFAADPAVGVLGSYDRARDGGERDWTPFQLPIRAAALPLPAIVGRRGRRPRLRPSDPRRVARRRSLLRTALDNGYRLGEHCLGGAYAVRGELARALADPRLMRDCAAWLETEIGEDALLGIAARAAGWSLGGLAGPGEAFALRHVGLPGRPEELLGDGAALVHSVRNHPDIAEPELRRLFAEARR